MSVNGIEIKVGQKWVTKAGEEVEIVLLDRDVWEGIPFKGSNGFWYDENGNAPGSEGNHESECLVQQVIEKENVFKEGDVVYTTTKGKGVVVQVATTRSDRVKVKHEDGKEFWHNPLNVSFSPWQAPNHKRPPEDGYWIIKEQSETNHHILKVVEGKLHYQTGESVAPRTQERMTLVKYLGKEIV